jgi:hypothetical protein
MSNLPDTDLYLIWPSEHGAWRGPNGCGYTRHVASAGRYTRDSAIKICRSALRGDLWTLFAFPEIPVREADLLAIDQDSVCRRGVKIWRGGKVYEVDPDEGAA